MMTNPKMSILLVEDEALLALDEAKQLRGLGYGVECAYRGEQAVEMVRERPGAFNLVLMDIDLGRGMDGA
jgi:CheY-like chemotaxis protein